MSITLTSSSFQVACDLVQPIARMLPEDDLFSLVGRIEGALDEAIDPPAFMNAATAARYVRRRFDIPLTVSSGPPYRRLGPQYVFARHDLDTWAHQRIAAAPAVAASATSDGYWGDRPARTALTGASTRPHSRFSATAEEGDRRDHLHHAHRRRRRAG
jgi:hypothetical protein